MLARLLFSILSQLSTPSPPATWVRHVVDAHDAPRIEKGNSSVVDSVISAAQ